MREHILTVRIASELEDNDLKALLEHGVDAMTDFLDDSGVKYRFTGTPVVQDIGAPLSEDMGRFHRDGDDTEKAAAVFNAPRANTQRERVLRRVVERANYGATFDELVVDLNMYSAQKRLHDLKLGEWVVETEHTRPTRTGAQARVYVATEKARQWAA